MGCPLGNWRMSSSRVGIQRLSFTQISNTCCLPGVHTCLAHLATRGLPFGRGQLHPALRFFRLAGEGGQAGCCVAWRTARDCGTLKPRDLARCSSFFRLDPQNGLASAFLLVSMNRNHKSKVPSTKRHTRSLPSFKQTDKCSISWPCGSGGEMRARSSPILGQRPPLLLEERSPFLYGYLGTEFWTLTFWLKPCGFSRGDLQQVKSCLRSGLASNPVSFPHFLSPWGLHTFWEVHFSGT